ncbi:MAG: 4Fe-4S binding protein, partial [Nitrospirae bacterium]|nr:4Fe-4S binding protein [Nitrospirota bacterium]
MKDELKNLALSEGISAFGAGDIEDLRQHFDALPPEQTEGLSYGISLAVQVSDAVLKGVITGPTRHYLHHYKMLNLLLDQTALKLTLAIQQAGYRALPIPASQIVDWEKQTAHLSHKMIAVRTGIGWIGRNNLLVHPEFGSKIRLATILTDMPLKMENPVETNPQNLSISSKNFSSPSFEKIPSLPPFDKGGLGGIFKRRTEEFPDAQKCGNCRKCIEICPVSAIKEDYREWDKTACLEKL